MIPANIDYCAIVRELVTWGIVPSKIELICGFSQGYVSHMLEGRYKDMTYQRAARLYNFWWDERELRGLNTMQVLSVAPMFEKNQHLVATT